MFYWSALPCWARILDIALAGILAILVAVWGVRWKSEPKAQEPNVSERDLGLSAISSQLSLGICTCELATTVTFNP
jgi:hypothetical protein